MYSALVFLVRICIGLVVMFFIWFVFDRIHDRNTEIIAAIIGLQYSYIFLVSRRLDYFGLTIFSFFGRSTSYFHKIPYDQVLRDELGIKSNRRHLYLNVIFAASIELLCIFRLFTSLIGHGWQALPDPINRLIILPF